LRANANALTIEKKAIAHDESQRISADNEAEIIRAEAEARLDVAKNRTTALIKESNAETNQANNMEGMRRHTEKMSLVKGMETMASK
jgi:hypothetical protein